MSHNGSIICPNCNSEAEKNYCSQCGQATHLHDETFGSLVMHFFAHYFHYESKFWQTIKTLCIKPGALTVAYRKKQRARFVPPISLYLFVVVAYFVLSSLVETIYKKYGIVESAAVAQQEKIARGKEKESSRALDRIMGKKNKEKVFYITEHADEYNAKVMNYLPKIFLFLPPVFALLLCLLFIDKREFLYVDHVVFAFHLHIPVFFILLLSDLVPNEAASNTIIMLGFLGWLFYSMRAMTVVYRTHWLRALLSSAFVIGFDFIIFMVSFVVILVNLL
jgi:hypothetical protein